MASGELGTAIRLAAPAAIIGVVSMASATAGALAGFAAALVLTARNPIAAIPLLLVAAGYQQVAQVFGIQFGWFVVFGAVLGAALFATAKFPKIRCDPTTVLFIIIPITFASISTLISDDPKVYRNILLIAILFMVSVLMFVSSYSRQQHIYKMVRSSELTTAVGLTGAVIALMLLGFLVLGTALSTRAGEISVALGETESSPSALSRVLGFCAIVCLSSIVTLTDLSRLSRAILTVCGAICVLGMFYTGSRMPMIALGISVLAVVVAGGGFSSRLPLMTRLWNAGILIGGTLVAAITVFGGRYVSLPFMENDGTLRISRAPTLEGNVRLELWQDHFSQVTALEALIGGGVGSLGNPHSVYVGALATFGLVGVFVLLSYIVRGFAGLYRLRSIAGFCIFGYVLLSYISSGDIDRMQFWILSAVAIILGYANVLAQSRGPGAPARRSMQQWA